MTVLVWDSVPKWGCYTTPTPTRAGTCKADLHINLSNATFVAIAARPLIAMTCTATRHTSWETASADGAETPHAKSKG
jgi:hypothetical protein